MNPFDDVPHKKHQNSVPVQSVTPDNMSIGTVRTLFSQLRNTENVHTKTCLFNGLYAGEFALMYLLGTLDKK